MSMLWYDIKIYTYLRVLVKIGM